MTVVDSGQWRRNQDVRHWTQTVTVLRVLWEECVMSEQHLALHSSAGLIVFSFKYYSPPHMLSPPPFLLPHLQYWDRQDLTSSQQIWVNFKQWMRTHQNPWASIKHPEFTVHIQTMQASSLFVWSVIAWNINKYLLFRFLMRGCTSHPVILPPHD